MKVSELIATWTEEEREQFADLIAECLQREQRLNLIGENMRSNEKELSKSTDHLISRLSQLSQGVQACNVYLQEIYLKIAKPKGSA